VTSTVSAEMGDGTKASPRSRRRQRGGWSQIRAPSKASSQHVDEATCSPSSSEPTKLRDAKAENPRETA